MSSKKTNYHYLAATITATSHPIIDHGITLPSSPICYGVQIQLANISAGQISASVSRAIKWVETQTAFSKVSLDNAAARTTPFTNKSGEIARHVVIIEGAANPEWVLAAGKQVVYAKPCNCGNRQGTCANAGVGGCLDGKLEGN